MLVFITPMLAFISGCSLPPGCSVRGLPRGIPLCLLGVVQVMRVLCYSYCFLLLYTHSFTEKHVLIRSSYALLDVVGISRKMTWRLTCHQSVQRGYHHASTARRTFLWIPYRWLLPLVMCTSDTRQGSGD